MKRNYMDILEEKVKLIKKISYQGEFSLELQEQLHQLLLNDTNGGKLYKYRAFDTNGYSLKNLENRTLHCSLPETFNDPFDSKIGLDIESLLENAFGDRFNEMYVKIETEMKKKEMYKFGNIPFSKDLSDYIKSFNNKGETESLLKYNGSWLANLLSILFPDEIIKQYLGINNDVLFRIIKNIDAKKMPQLLKEDIKIKDFAYANNIDDDIDEIDFFMKLYRKFYPEYNDAINELEKIIKKIEKEFDKITNELFIVGCLCTDYKKRLMWSHYADSHKGFCIEYDFENMVLDKTSQWLLPVIYSEKRPLIPWEIALNQSGKVIKEAEAKLMMGILTKDKIWNYENEWRIIIKNQKNREIAMPLVTCIYLGAAIEKENRDKIINIAKKQNIPVKQMKIDRGEYELHAIDII